MGTCTLRAAIQESNAHPGADTVLVPGGTYTLTIPGADDLAATGDLDIRDDLTLRGAGASHTIISGGRLDRVFHIVGPATVQFSDVTITDGAASNGGGILNMGNLTVLNSLITANEFDIGGGIYTASGSTLHLDGTEVSNHLGDIIDSRAGGIYAVDAEVVLRNSTVQNNRNVALAGGIEAHGGRLTLTNSTIQRNFSRSSGGGIYYKDGNSFRMDGGLVADNSTNDGDGGGIALIDVADAVLQGVTIRHNDAYQRGGGLYNNASNVTLRQAAIEDNGSHNGGGGIHSLGGLLVEASTIDGNGSGGSAGAIAGGGTVRNSTISGNSGAEGSLSMDGLVENSTIDGELDIFSVVPSLRSTIVTSDCPFGRPVSLGFNLERGTSCGLTAHGDLQNADPLLGPLADNGGPTRTHALLPGSPAIDAGSSAFCPATDQRGVARPQDGDHNGIAACDIGAFEVMGSADTRPPITTASLTPSPNPAGWNRTDVAVQLIAADDPGGSGVKAVTYSASGAQPIVTTTRPGSTATFTLTAEGVTSVTFVAVDNSGNQEHARTLSVDIDKTSPVLSFSGNVGTYTADQTVRITCSASDPPASTGVAGSGLASSTCPNVNAPAYTFDPGPNILTATAIDRAGNLSSKSTTFTVRVTYASVCALSRRFVANAGLAGGMCNVLDAAQKLEQRGLLTGKANLLRTYGQLVQTAQRVGAESPEHATILERLSGAL